MKRYRIPFDRTPLRYDRQSRSSFSYLMNSKETEPIGKNKVINLLKMPTLNEEKNIQYRRFHDWVMIVTNDVVVTVHKNPPGNDWK